MRTILFPYGNAHLRMGKKRSIFSFQRSFYHKWWWTDSVTPFNYLKATRFFTESCYVSLCRLLLDSRPFIISPIKCCAVETHPMYWDRGPDSKRICA